MNQKVKVEEVLSLLEDIESEDPIDWGMLAIDEKNATEMIVSSLVDQYNREWSELKPEVQHLAMLATIAKLVVENFTLNLKLRQ
jgi:hypothetical protein